MSAHDAQDKLTDGSVAKKLAGLGFPTFLGLAAVFSQSLVDTYFVGQLGRDYLAALSFTFPVALFFTSISIGLSAGVSSVVARSYGSTDLEAVRKITTDSLILSALLIAVFSLLGFFPLTSFSASWAPKETYFLLYIAICRFGIHRCPF